MGLHAENDPSKSDSVEPSRPESGSEPAHNDTSGPRQHLSSPALPEREMQSPVSVDNPLRASSPLAEVRRFAHEFRLARGEFLSEFHRAEDYFDSLLITAGIDKTAADYPSHITLNSIPDLRGHNPYPTIFGRDFTVSPNPCFIAAITVPFPAGNCDQSGDNQSSAVGAQPGFTQPGEKPRIPDDRMLLAWLEYNRGEQCYRLYRPNAHGLVDASLNRFKNLALRQQCPRDSWSWDGVEGTLREMLTTKGLVVITPDLGNFRTIWDDKIEIRAGDGSRKFPPPYELLADVLDVFAKLNIRRGGFLWSKVIAEPARPPAANITAQAKQFADINRVPEKEKRRRALEEQGYHLLGHGTDSYTVGCIGELVSRLAREASPDSSRRSLPFKLPESPLFVKKQNRSSQLLADLDDIITSWAPTPSRAPECVKDFFRAIDELREDAKLGGGITPGRCQEVIDHLETGLRGMADGGATRP
jgi:hypothetical protein